MQSEHEDYEGPWLEYSPVPDLAQKLQMDFGLHRLSHVA